MELNRYETVERVIIKLDNRILKLLNNEVLNSKELSTLIDLRSIYMKEYDGLTRSKNTHDMFNK